MKLLVLVCLCTVGFVQSVMTFRPNITDEYVVFNNMKNPYFTTEHHSSIALDLNRDVYLDVYNLNMKRIKQIETIQVECFDGLHCDTEISDLELRYLSLYASMIEMAGMTTIQEPYSIGLLRSTSQEYIMGKFTKIVDNEGKLLQMTFWIRLTTGKDKQHVVYNNLNGYSLTMGMLEMSVHERAHYDATNYIPHAGHCDEYQAVYNSMIQQSIRELEYFHRMTIHIMGTTANYLQATIIPIFIILIFCIPCIWSNTLAQPVRNVRTRKQINNV